MVVINIKSKFQRCSVDDFSYQLKKDYILSNIGKFLLKFLYISFFQRTLQGSWHRRRFFQNL